MTGHLFAECALPGCHFLTDTQGHPCPSCVRDCGDYLAHRPDGVAMTSDAQAARDRDVRAAYAAQQQLSVGAVDVARGERTAAIEHGREPKPGQQCWVCECRRSCHLIDGRWECRDCQQIR